MRSKIGTIFNLKSSQWLLTNLHKYPFLFNPIKELWIYDGGLMCFVSRDSSKLVRNIWYLYSMLSILLFYKNHVLFIQEPLPWIVDEDLYCALIAFRKSLNQNMKQKKDFFWRNDLFRLHRWLYGVVVLGVETKILYITVAPLQSCDCKVTTLSLVQVGSWFSPLVQLESPFICTIDPSINIYNLIF